MVPGGGRGAFLPLFALFLPGLVTAGTDIDFRDPHVVHTSFKSVVAEIQQLKAQLKELQGAPQRDAGFSSVLQRSGFGFGGSPSSGSSSKAGSSPSSAAAAKAGQPGKPGPGDPVDFPPVGVGEAPKGVGQFVPFGKHIPRKKDINYYVATGEQECKVCRRIISNSNDAGRNMYTLCNGEYPEYVDMCKAQQKVVQGCPEFTNNWCYQDYGGTQVLRSPCPDALICHYCLGINPLHCLE